MMSSLVLRVFPVALSEEFSKSSSLRIQTVVNHSQSLISQTLLLLVGNQIVTVLLHHLRGGRSTLRHHTAGNLKIVSAQHVWRQLVKLGCYLLTLHSLVKWANSTKFYEKFFVNKKILLKLIDTTCKSMTFSHGVVGAWLVCKNYL